MGDLINGTWQTPQERAFMRALDAKIAGLTRIVEALRETHARRRATHSRGTGEIIKFSTARTTDNR
jgi:hypothetical protein